MPYKPMSEYEPRQRGQVAQGQKPRKGTRLLKDGDITYEECEDCGGTLRVRREGRAAPILWCPCGYETVAP